MKATIDGNGVMHISPETELEQFALAQWAKEANADWLSPRHPEESFLWRGSRLLVAVVIPGQQHVQPGWPHSNAFYQSPAIHGTVSSKGPGE